MKCPKCGTDLPPRFKFCGECGLKLPCAFATKDGREDFTQVSLTAQQQTNGGGKSALGVDKERFQGIFAGIIWLKMSILEGNFNYLQCRKIGGDRMVAGLRTIKAAALSKVKGCFIQHSTTLLVWNFNCKWSIWTKQERWILLFCTHWTSTKTSTLFYKLHHNLYFHSWCAQVSIYSPDSSSEPMFVLQENFFKPKVTFCSYFLQRPVLILRQ